LEIGSYNSIEFWDRRLKCILATKIYLRDLALLISRIEIVQDSLDNVIQNSSYDMMRYDAYVAGPPSMMPPVLKSLTVKGIKHKGIKMISFGG
jgi:hypothetical protein